MGHQGPEEQGGRDLHDPEDPVYGGQDQAVECRGGCDLCCDYSHMGLEGEQEMVHQERMPEVRSDCQDVVPLCNGQRQVQGIHRVQEYQAVPKCEERTGQEQVLEEGDEEVQEGRWQVRRMEDDQLRTVPCTRRHMHQGQACIRTCEVESGGI